MGSYFSSEQAQPVIKKYFSSEDLTNILKDLKIDDVSLIHSIPPLEELKDHVIYEKQLKDVINKYHPNDIPEGFGAFTISCRLFIWVFKDDISHDETKQEFLEYVPIIINIINARNKELEKESENDHSTSRKKLVKDYERCLEKIKNIYL